MCGCGCTSGKGSVDRPQPVFPPLCPICSTGRRHTRTRTQRKSTHAPAEVAVEVPVDEGVALLDALLLLVRQAQVGPQRVGLLLRQQPLLLGCGSWPLIDWAWRMRRRLAELAGHSLTLWQSSHRKASRSINGHMQHPATPPPSIKCPHRRTHTARTLAHGEEDLELLLDVLGVRPVALGPVFVSCVVGSIDREGIVVGKKAGKSKGRG